MINVTTSQPIKYLGGFVVEIYIDGVYWDCVEFATLAAAEAFVADPLKNDREKSNEKAERAVAKEAEEIKYRAFGYEKISKGRRVAPKPGIS